MEITELYYPEIEVRAGGYSFREGIEIEASSSKASYFDWAKIRFTGQFRDKIALPRRTPASIALGYGGVLESVFSGYVDKPIGSGVNADELYLKDEMLLLEDTVIHDTFLSTTPQELIAFILAKAGAARMKLSPKSYPVRKTLPIRQQNAVQAIHTVNAAWGIKPCFFFSRGVFYWDETPEQQKIYTFQYGVNILALNRVNGLWELETVSAPFVRHSHKIHLVHPKVSGEREVQKVVFTTNDSGFIRTFLYF